jgi:multisubunit Na+/H+ antiporter MnhF subunit
MTVLQQTILLIVILILSAIMAVLQMWSGDSVPMEFWAVIYGVLGFIGIPVTASLAGKALKAALK